MIALHKMSENQKRKYFKQVNLLVFQQRMKGRFTVQPKRSVAQFREEGYPKIDFYLCSGIWRIVGTPETQKTIRYSDDEGNSLRGAKNFIEWYENEKWRNQMEKTIRTKDGVTLARIIPARVVVDVDPDTKQEYAYEYKGETGHKPWLNLVTELYHDQNFFDLIKFDVIRVDFGEETSMNFREWQEAGFPYFLKIEEREGEE